VKIIGMNNLDEVEPADESRTFRQQSYPRRVLVAFAGPGMNLLLALAILFGVAIGLGLPVPDAWPQVEPVEGGAADQAGMLPGDTLVSFAGRPLPDEFSSDGANRDDFVAMVHDHTGETVDVVVERNGVERTLELDLGLVIEGVTGVEWPEVGVLANSPAYEAALLPEDVIREVDGRPAPPTYDEFVDLVLASGGTTLDLVVEREGELYTTGLDVRPDVDTSGFLGVSPYEPPAQPDRNPLTAAVESGRRTGEFVWLSAYGLGRFFSPQGLTGFADQVASTPPVEEPAGGPAPDTAEPEVSRYPPLPFEPDPIDAESNRVHPILGVITIGSQLGGVADILVLVALLNVFLAMFNLIPLLPFDGGHIAVATYERIREGLARRRILGARLVGSRYFADYAKLLPVTYVVVALIVSIGIGALYLDAVDPVDLGN
jgi:membrane-associated protease RseP (regulator of RpoE activity)